MRILFMHHFPLGLGEAGQLVERWARSVEANGHEVRLLIVDHQPGEGDRTRIDRVVCRADDPSADLPFELPRFGTSQGEHEPSAFGNLSDKQLSQYRDQLRRRLDKLIDQFDPHVIHAQHVWVQAQLALETGVPYLINAWGPELIDYQRDERYRSLAEQAAENAGRILVPQESPIGQRIIETFGVAPERVLAMDHELTLEDSPLSARDQAAASQRLVGIYQQVLDERFGPRA